MGSLALKPSRLPTSQAAGAVRYTTVHDVQHATGLQITSVRSSLHVSDPKVGMVSLLGELEKGALRHVVQESRR